ncbi:proteasome inhibitor 31 kDa [Megachile rotundata]|uniref:proteasome inhibitor 31 kDa n=1 Tax=Megachile rotundata TaxID=143995 RepID=UPI003FD25733
MVEENNTFGFELIQSLYDNEIVKKEDVLILFIHWYLIKHGFKCIGLGDSKAFNESEKGTELLPDGWNSHPNYTFRYINDKKLYILHGIKSDEDLLTNLLKVDDQNVSSAQFPINQTINGLHGPLESLISSHQSVINIIQKDLIDPLLPGNTIDNSTQTGAINREERNIEIDRSPDPLRVGPAIRPSSVPHRWDPLADPSSVGGADLNPFGRGGGGMIYDPFSTLRNPVNPLRPALGVPGRLPPGAVPPHARFDPFGPPDIEQPRRRHDPDNDHLPPPGYDDMFM